MKKVKNFEEDRKGTIELYENQLDAAGDFMKIVLIEAIRKLKETDIDPEKIERWVVKLERNWMKFL
jgi:hypothetical protein